MAVLRGRFSFGLKFACGLGSATTSGFAMFSHVLVRLAAIVGILWSVIAFLAVLWLVFTTPEGDLLDHWWKFALIVFGPPVPLLLLAMLFTVVFEPRPHGRY